MSGLGSRHLALKSKQPSRPLRLSETYAERKERLDRENAEWAARSGPVTVTKREQA